MRAVHVEITASGSVSATGDGTNAYVIGVSNSGFTSIKFHEGTDNTGPVVALIDTQGVTAWNYELYFRNLYVEVSGAGEASIWLA